MTANNSDIIITGGGAAGCFAAVIAAEQGKNVLLLESGRLMHKLSITGKGRCNLTNNADIETVLRNIKTNPRFMQSALHQFGAQDVMAFFERRGVELKTERGNRVFPVSDKAEEITDALQNRMNILRVKIIYDRVVSVLIENNAVTGVKCEKGVYYAPKIILATGGLSYPKTGSTGDGYRIAAALGHNIIKPKPALVPIVTREDVSALAGLTLKNVRLSLFAEGVNKPLYTEQGELLFTHSGISGPLVLSASCYIQPVNIRRDAEKIIRDAVPYRILIDLKPVLDRAKLDSRLLRDFAENKNRQIQNALGELLPKKIILPVILQAKIDPEKRVNEITALERGRLLETLKGFTLTFAELGSIEEAVITDGGVDVKEINPKTMESKLVKGLHFAGEIIDVAGFTGGFNLQIAFSTAFAAATEK
ncbi:MAG: NAD(P)/FAD-dependent oxidoreductase [Oscillospiraceae bacterium]|nr:NAD(P)/FAD-dependent oxidoreductase [Oscillospiraceae bacterium]